MPDAQPWCLFLRAVNVAGHAPLRMESLRDELMRAGLTDVRTVLASGNVTCRSALDAAALKSRVEEALGALVGHPVSVILRQPQEIDALLAATAPYEAALQAGEKLAATLLGARPDAAALARLAAFDGKGDDAFTLDGTVLVLCRNGYGETALSNARIERLLGVNATTRNLATLRKVRALAG